MTPVAQLAGWVAAKHSGIQIRHTAEPYFTHLQHVAELAGPFTTFGYEIGLCHDLLEDTDTTTAELQTALHSFGYAHTQADLIVAAVIELTDVFTAAAYPQLSKKERKQLEAERLTTISGQAQTVKYADLIDNISWVLTHTPDKAGRYLKKKKLLVMQMNSGNEVLRNRLLTLIDDALNGIK